jgi:hypothetical protein
VEWAAVVVKTTTTIDCWFIIFCASTLHPDFQARGYWLLQSAAAMTTVCTAFTAAVDSIDVQEETEKEKKMIGKPRRTFLCFTNTCVVFLNF